MKKCAPAVGYDPAVMERRDAVLASLGSAGGLYRYSTSGAHAYARSHHGEHDEAEKTFAIIVGLLAGVALIIILLTFMRKAFGRHGK
ncbi:hypothetical protein L1987_65547 [Smallanthus sonchifolius]|uniref:Uncharacterized protein n=1 Tax=Smallanthus sonchifolius TaxID=185202 RepID=A0ACB9BUW9_9ASTR|nr:hypothetical protein L1987_65547 [Smallanthus sonchifolius]